MPFDPASRVQDFRLFGKFGDVNPGITHSSTRTFLHAQRMEAAFGPELEGAFVYSRHFNPTDKHRSETLVRMEDDESAQVRASGMGAISRGS